jgi:hypothetical protein
LLPPSLFELPPSLRELRRTRSSQGLLAMTGRGRRDEVKALQKAVAGRRLDDCCAGCGQGGLRGGGMLHRADEYPRSGRISGCAREAPEADISGRGSG